MVSTSNCFVDARAPRLARVNGAVAILIVAVSLAELLLPNPAAGRVHPRFGHTAEPVQGVVTVTLFIKRLRLVQHRVLRRNPRLRKMNVAIVIRATLSPQMIAAVIMNQPAAIPVPHVVDAAEPCVKELAANVVKQFVMQRGIGNGDEMLSRQAAERC